MWRTIELRNRRQSAALDVHAANGIHVLI